jgi:hypothetical protein
MAASGSSHGVVSTTAIGSTGLGSGTASKADPPAEENIARPRAP